MPASDSQNHFLRISMVRQSDGFTSSHPALGMFRVRATTPSTLNAAQGRLRDLRGVRPAGYFMSSTPDARAISCDSVDKRNPWRNI